MLKRKRSLQYPSTEEVIKRISSRKPLTGEEDFQLSAFAINEPRSFNQLKNKVVFNKPSTLDESDTRRRVIDRLVEEEISANRNVDRRDSGIDFIINSPNTIRRLYGQGL